MLDFLPPWLRSPPLCLHLFNFLSVPLPCLWCCPHSSFISTPSDVWFFIGLASKYWISPQPHFCHDNISTLTKAQCQFPFAWPYPYFWFHQVVALQNGATRLRVDLMKHFSLRDLISFSSLLVRFEHVLSRMFVQKKRFVEKKKAVLYPQLKRWG